MAEQQRPYIGCTLSLISKAKIRYTGVLASIDTANTTLTLHKVQSHGTEDRTPGKFIPPQPGTYDMIIFNGHDIEDLSVVQKEPEPIQDPAILNMQKQTSAPPVSSAPSAQPTQAPPPQQKQQQQQQQTRQQQQQQQQPANNNAGAIGQKRNDRQGPPQRPPNAAGNNSNNNTNNAKSGNQLGHNADHSAFSKPSKDASSKPESAADALKRNGQRQNSGSGKLPVRNIAKEREDRKEKIQLKQKEQLEKYKEEFDFASGNAKFDKNEIAKELEKKLNVTEVK